MKHDNTGADSPTANKTDDTVVVVRILVNGALIDNLHHAAGKTMELTKSKADILMGMTPSQVEIIGV